MTTPKTATPTRCDIAVLIRDNTDKGDGWLRFLPAADAILEYWSILNKNTTLHIAPTQCDVLTEEVTMQQVRLVCGEGKLETRHVLNAVNIILKRRAEKAALALPSADGGGE